jgi:hypothetical protein
LWIPTPNRQTLTMANEELTTEPETPLWKLLARFGALIGCALLVAYLVWFIGFNPFHLRELQW